jgi:hypothetical protein
MLRIYFKFAWLLFLRQLKRLEPEYTPATSKGKQASTAFCVAVVRAAWMPGELP